MVAKAPATTMKTKSEMKDDVGEGNTLPEESDVVLQLAQKLCLLRVPPMAGMSGAGGKGEGGGEAGVVNGPRVSLASVQEELLELGMAKKYVAMCEQFEQMADAEKVESVHASNAAREKELDAAIADAEENLGEVEVRDAMLAKAVFLRGVGESERAETLFKETEEKTAAVGQKMDMLFMLLRTSMAEGDWAAVKKLLQRAKQLFEEGGDWERKNRLKVYEGVHALATRQFKRAAELFLDSITTFTSTEIFDYTSLVFYAVITSLVSLDRVTLKKKVVDSPEVRSVIGKVPHLEELVHSLYDCKYGGYLKAMLGISDSIYYNMYLHPHFRYTIRELRVVGYAQFLESYRSVTISSMATSFGVSVDFLDKEISTFICRGRLGCKIDRVAGIIETVRPDGKNASYQQVIKDGDFLLNRVQKLSKVIEL